MSTFLQRKIERMMELTLAEQCQLDELQKNVRVIKAGTIAWNQGDRVNSHYIVLDGWALLYAELPSGSRQIINVRIPGDIIGLSAPIHPRTSYAVRALTPMHLVPVNLGTVLHLSQRYPRLLATLFWIAAHDEIMLCEQIIRLGRRCAYTRVAHLLVELYLRSEWIGLTETPAFALPLSQEQVADALGLSVVHANRMVRRLAAEDLIEVGRSRIRVREIQALAEIAQFDLETFSALRVPTEIRRLAS